MTELEFQILNAMADDAEDVEQIYLTANHDSLGTGALQPKYPLRDIIDGIKSLLNDGQIRAEFCNDPTLPSRVAEGSLYQYWFSPTEKGRQAWTAYTSLRS